MLNQSKVAILGTGTMGRALGKGMLSAGVLEPASIHGTVKHQRELAQVRAQVSFEVSTDNDAAAGAADIILLCTKPRDASPLLESLTQSGALAHKPLLISIAAGISTSVLEAATGGDLRVVRAMPNTPGQIGCGVTVWTAGEHKELFTDADIERCKGALGALGKEIYVEEESYVDMSTSISGSGPAYIFLLIEAMVDAGVQEGFSREVATILVHQTILGSVKYAMESGEHPAVLKNSVTSPAGTTASAIYELEKGNFRTVVQDAIWACYRRSLEMGGLDSNVGPGRSAGPNRPQNSHDSQKNGRDTTFKGFCF